VKVAERAEHLSFEEEWPVLAARLDRRMSRSMADPLEREELVQEAGVRLFTMWERVEPDKPLWPLVLTIALNLRRDHYRTPAWAFTELDDDIPDRHDGEAASLARVELERVFRALLRLQPAQRDVLLAELGRGTAEAGRSTAATKMLRMRARRRLHLLLERGSGVLGVVVLRPSSLWQQVRSSIGARLPHYVSIPDPGNVAAGALAIALAATGIGAADVDPRTERAASTSAHDHASGAPASSTTGAHRSVDDLRAARTRDARGGRRDAPPGRGDGSGGGGASVDLGDGVDGRASIAGGTVVIGSDGSVCVAIADACAYENDGHAAGHVKAEAGGQEAAAGFEDNEKPCLWIDVAKRSKCS